MDNPAAPKVRGAGSPALALLFAVAAALVLPARAQDWRGDTAQLLESGDYAVARKMIEQGFSALAEADRPTALAFLAYTSGKLSDRPAERSWVQLYFETYGDVDPDISFLGYETRRGFLDFWGVWTKSYPLTRDFNILEPVETPAGPPAEIQVGLEIVNPAFYKLTADGVVIDGGFWPSGFHILSLPASELFTETSVREFRLHLKAGDLVISKPLRLDVQIAGRGAPSRPLLPTSQVSPTYKALEGQIDVYVGGRKILSSQKRRLVETPMTFPLGGPSAPGQKPFMPPPRLGEPFSGAPAGINVVDAISQTYKAIKDLLSKKPPKPSPPSYRKVPSMSLLYSVRAEGGPRDVEAVVRLTPGKADLER